MWLLAALSAFTAADLAAALLESSLQTPPPPLEIRRSPPPAPPTEAQAAEVMEVLMGKSPEKAPPLTRRPSHPGSAAPPQKAASAVPVQKLKLRGTMLGGGIRLAVVEAAGESHVVGPGDRVGGYTVAEVSKTSVTLRRAEETVTLEMELARLDRGTAASPSSGPILPGHPEAGPPEGTVIPGRPESPEGRLTMEEIRSILDNAPEVARTVRVVPVEKDNQTYGIRLEFRTQDNLLARLGLKHNDILLSLNGQPIRNAEDLYTAYRLLRNSPALEFEVDRGGQVQTVTYDLAE